MTHRRSGNCFFGVSLPITCTLHGEPRGTCSRCGRCATCDIYGPLAPKEGDPRMGTATRQDLEAKAAAGIWTTREGEDIHVTAMEDHHLLAADRMLRRKGAIGPRILRAYLTGPGPNGDAAQEAFDAEFAEVLEAPVSPFIDHFDDEIKRRGLTRLEV